MFKHLGKIQTGSLYGGYITLEEQQKCQLMDRSSEEPYLNQYAEVLSSITLIQNTSENYIFLHLKLKKKVNTSD